MESRKRLKVLCPIQNEKTGKTYWKNCGSAFENRDLSINIYLDTLPTNGKLHLREYDGDEFSRRRSDDDNRPSGDSIPF